jgi:hypothetical protein
MADDNGQPVEQYRVMCKDITVETECIAADLEQYMTLALTNMPQKDEVQQSQSTDTEDSAVKRFYEEESPSCAAVEEQAVMLQMMVNMSNGIQASKIMKTFEELVRGGLIYMEGNVKMPYLIWRQLHRDDKAKIMYNYIAFFVNPLQKLVSMSEKIINNGL